MNATQRRCLTSFCLISCQELQALAASNPGVDIVALGKFVGFVCLLVCLFAYFLKCMGSCCGAVMCANVQQVETNDKRLECVLLH